MKKMLYILVFLTLFIGIERINAYTEYKIGDVVSYNGIDFYIIKNSDSKDNSVTMLKAEPLSVKEVNTYGGVGTENNHVNMYNESTGSSAYRTAYDNNGYGGMAYYTSVDCGYGDDSNHTSEGCTSDYAQSEVKYVVDAWKTAKAPAATEARLISYEDLLNDLGYENNFTCTGGCFYSGSLENVPNWVYNSNYWYCTMSPNNDSASYVWGVGNDGSLGDDGVRYNDGVVRPVITLKKTALGDEDESIIEDKKEDSKIDKKDNIDDNKTNQTKTTVKVDNTYMSSSILLIILGFITASISVSIIYKLSNKKR